jgi:hypothetical protein
MLPGLSFLSEWWELEVHISHAAPRPDVTATLNQALATSGLDHIGDVRNHIVSFKIDHGPP